MRNTFIFLFSVIFLNSCSPYYHTVSLKKIDTERKELVHNFAENFLKKCANKDYSSFEGFNVSKRFERLFISDSIKSACDEVEKKYGTVKIKELVSVHTTSRPADFIDIFNYKIELEKLKKPFFLHIGVYRNGNYFDLPFYFDEQENHIEYMLKKYRQNKKKK